MVFKCATAPRMSAVQDNRVGAPPRPGETPECTYFDSVSFDYQTFFSHLSEFGNLSSFARYTKHILYSNGEARCTYAGQPKALAAGSYGSVWVFSLLRADVASGTPPSFCVKITSDKNELAACSWLNDPNGGYEFRTWFPQFRIVESSFADIQDPQKNKTVFLVEMPLFEGTLHDFVTGKKPKLEESQTLFLAAEIAERCAAFKRKGVAYGDIKSANILFSSCGFLGAFTWKFGDMGSLTSAVVKPGAGTKPNAHHTTTYPTPWLYALDRTSARRCGMELHAPWAIGVLMLQLQYGREPTDFLYHDYVRVDVLEMCNRPEIQTRRELVDVVQNEYRRKIDRFFEANAPASPLFREAVTGMLFAPSVEGQPAFLREIEEEMDKKGGALVI